MVTCISMLEGGKKSMGQLDGDKEHLGGRGIQIVLMCLDDSIETNESESTMFYRPSQPSLTQNRKWRENEKFRKNNFLFISTNVHVRSF